MQIWVRTRTITKVHVFYLWPPSVTLTFKLRNGSFVRNTILSRKMFLSSHFKIHPGQCELDPRQAQKSMFLTFDPQVWPWPFSYGLVLSRDVLYSLAEHYCKVVSKSSMHTWVRARTRLDGCTGWRRHIHTPCRQCGNYAGLDKNGF